MRRRSEESFTSSSQRAQRKTFFMIFLWDLRVLDALRKFALSEGVFGKAIHIEVAEDAET